MKEPETQEEVRERRLENEYSELCNDWWQRDKSVLDKLSAASILFGLLGWAVATVPPDRLLIKVVLLVAGAIFSLVLCISVAKDTLYRDGTEALLKRLAAKLHITDSLKGLADPSAGSDDGLDFGKLQFPRKVRIPPDESSLKAFPLWLGKWFQKQPTFKWILVFFMVAFLIFVILLILVLVNWGCGLNLPI